MEEVSNFLKEHSDFVTCENGKIRCTLTGHEMPARLQILQAYVNGKKYQMTKSCYSQDFSKYEPYIVQSKHHPKRLYCTLTKQEINKIPEEVESHVKGRRYQNALKKAQSKEPSMEEEGVWIPEEGESEGEEGSEFGFEEGDDEEEEGEEGEDEEGEEEEGEEEEEEEPEPPRKTKTLKRTEHSNQTNGSKSRNKRKRST